MSMTRYKINGKTIQFDVDGYLKNGLDIKRINMPQVNMESFLGVLSDVKKFVGVVKTTIRVDQLFPTQGEINMEKVLRMVQDGYVVPKEKKQFVVSKDLNIIDGHHRHVYLLLNDPTQKVTVYIVDMGTKELLGLLGSMKNVLNKPKALQDCLMESFGHTLLGEDYGQQPPSMSGGMGDVEYGQPTTADSEGEKGSGDIMVGKKKKKISYTKIKPAIESIKEVFGIDLSYLLGKSPIQESVTVNSDGVIESDDGIPWERCINIPVERKYFKMDKAFKVKTMEGITEGKKGDYLMRGVDGEMYPCDSDIFHKTYTHLNALSEGK